MRRSFFLVAVVGVLSGCASPPKPSGFISDYSNLKDAEPGVMRYIAPEAREYTKLIIDPVEIRVQRESGGLTPSQRAEVARYLREAIGRVLRSRGYTLVTEPDVGVARIRVAITDVQDAKWYLNLHPATKITRAGRGSASMEIEVVDSVTGKQIAAAIRTGSGKQFELNPFSTVNDVKSVIDQWAESAGIRIDEMRKK